MADQSQGTIPQEGTASSGIFQVDNLPGKISEEARIDIAVRMSGSGVGIVPSTASGDFRRTQNNSFTVAARKKIQGIEKIEAQNDLLVTQNTNIRQAITGKQIEIESRNSIVSNTRNKKDVIRALQKAQSRCNHKYDASRNCIYCSKKRDSHVYDLKNQSILRNL